MRSVSGNQKNNNFDMLLSTNQNKHQKIDLKMDAGASLVAQWLRVCLPMQGTQVRALV